MHQTAFVHNCMLMDDFSPQIFYVRTFRTASGLAKVMHTKTILKCAAATEIQRLL
jgi:hypothetical protein